MLHKMLLPTLAEDDRFQKLQCHGLLLFFLFLLLVQNVCHRVTKIRFSASILYTIIQIVTFFVFIHGIECLQLSFELLVLFVIMIRIFKLELCQFGLLIYFKIFRWLLQACWIVLKINFHFFD